LSQLSRFYKPQHSATPILDIKDVCDGQLKLLTRRSVLIEHDKLLNALYANYSLAQESTSLMVAANSILLLAPPDSLASAIAQSLRDRGAPLVAAPALPMDDSPTLRREIVALGTFDAAIILPQNLLIKPFMDTTDTEWDEAISGNFERPLWLAQAFAQTLIDQQRGGSIIFVSSVAAASPLVHTSALGTSLGALRALARMAAVDLAPHNITVNVIECGWTDSDAAAPYLTPDAQAHITQGTPTGRLVSAAEIASLCAYLASPAARSITGAIMTLDGGYSLTRSAGRGVLGE
jgi:NAD(P)-dependent dehydrogenase (short-subunit alcohol dehydrogenase family)